MGYLIQPLKCFAMKLGWLFVKLYVYVLYVNLKALERKQFYLSTSMLIFIKYNIKKIPVLKYLHICVII